MKLINTTNAFGLVSIVIHWVFALAVFGLFGLGLYMVELTYYDPWYRGALALHESVGVTLLALLFVRVWWRLMNVQPQPEPAKAWEHLAAKIMHGLLYLIPLLLMLSGYLISTADGRALAVFDVISLPALPSIMENQEDVFGKWHAWLAWTVIGLASVHTAAALKHQFINKNHTLKRMLGTQQTL